MESILNLEDWKIDGFFLKKQDTKNGVVENTTLGGVSYNIMDFIDYYYDLKIMYLTNEERIEINKELLSLAKSNKKIEFYVEDIKKWGFDSFSENTRVALNFQPSKINFKPSEIVGLYDLSLEVFERVKV